MQSLPLQKVSIQQVEAWEQVFIRNSAGRNYPEVAIPYGIAMTILREFFGISWCERNVMLRSTPEAGPTDRTFFGDPFTEKRFNRDVAKFMRTQPQNVPDQTYHCMRVIELAEMLFNFQEIQGISSLFKMIGEDPQSIEGNYFVLQAARIVCFNNPSFRFVIPEGKKGGDNYDAEVTLASGVTAYCEMKCKLEQTQLSKGAILRRLQRSRGQLPKDGMGVVFISIPDSWLYDSQILPTISEVLKEFFRNTKRVVAVIMYVDEWQFFGKRVARILTVNQFINEHATHRDKYPTKGIFPERAEPPPSVYKRLFNTPVRDMPLYPFFIVPPK